MNRLSIIVSVLVTSLALGGCAVENSGTDDPSSTDTGSDDIVAASSDTASVVHSGTGGGLVVHANRSTTVPQSQPVAEIDDGSGSGPQPEPWRPGTAIRASKPAGNGSTNK